MKDLLYNFLYEGNTTVNPTLVVTSMLVALALGLIMYFTYYLTFQGVSYNKKFNTTLLLLSMITAMVMNIIGSSVALSLGMVGALSIVRFRTAIKDPRDTAYIFWAICIGLGVGTDNYYIVTIGTVIVAVVAIISSFIIKIEESYLLVVRCTNLSSEKVRMKIFENYHACKLRSQTTINNDTEMIYQIKLKNKEDINKYEELRKIRGVNYVNIVSKNGETLG